MDLVTGGGRLTEQLLEDDDFYAPSRRLELLQILRDDIDFSDRSLNDANGWELVQGLFHLLDQPNRDIDLPLRWTLLTFQRDICRIVEEHPDFIDRVQFWFARAIIFRRPDIVELLANTIGKHIPAIWHRSSAFVFAVRLADAGLGAFNSLRKIKEAFLKYVAHSFDVDYGFATTLAMTSSIRFWWWRTMLECLPYEVETYVARAMASSSSFYDEGWEYDTLLALFLHDFIPVSHSSYGVCWECGESSWLSKETWWLETLQKIKKRQPLDLASAISDIQWERAVSFDDEANIAHQKGWVHVRSPNAFDPTLSTSDEVPLGDILHGLRKSERNVHGEDAERCETDPGYDTDEGEIDKDEHISDDNEPGNNTKEAGDDEDEQDYDDDEARNEEAYSRNRGRNCGKGIFAHCHVEPPPTGLDGSSTFQPEDDIFQWAYRSAEEITCPDCWAKLEEELALAHEAGTSEMPGAFVPG